MKIILSLSETKAKLCDLTGIVNFLGIEQNSRENALVISKKNQKNHFDLTGKINVFVIQQNSCEIVLVTYKTCYLTRKIQNFR